MSESVKIEKNLVDEEPNSICEKRKHGNEKPLIEDVTKVSVDETNSVCEKRKSEDDNIEKPELKKLAIEEIKILVEEPKTRIELDSLIERLKATENQKAILMFSSPTCPNCEQQKPFFYKIKEKKTEFKDWVFVYTCLNDPVEYDGLLEGIEVTYNPYYVKIDTSNKEKPYYELKLNQDLTMFKLFMS